MQTLKKVLATAIAIAVAVAVGIVLVTALKPVRLTGNLNIYLHSSENTSQAPMADMIERFQDMHPDLNIETTFIDRTKYRDEFRKYLTSRSDTPDAIVWMAGDRMMARHVEDGLFEDISDLWQGELASELASGRPQSTQYGKQYAVPYSNYHFGMYYREDLYRKYGLAEPQTWTQMKSNCQVMLDNGHKCYAIGSKEMAAIWFDYLNMRTNGYHFHVDLIAGKVPWSDDRVRQTFMNWRELLDMGAYHYEYSWESAARYVANGQAGALLYATPVIAKLLEAGLTAEQVGFYQFPEIAPGLPLGEVHMMDTFHIPSGAQNKANARGFLKFVASADNQSLVNKQLGLLPVNAASPVLEDKYLKEGVAMLNDAAGLSQLFMMRIPYKAVDFATTGFHNYMTEPENLDRLLDSLERERKRGYKCIFCWMDTNWLPL